MIWRLLLAWLGFNVVFVLFLELRAVRKRRRHPAPSKPIGFVTDDARGSP